MKPLPCLSVLSRMDYHLPADKRRTSNMPTSPCTRSIEGLRRGAWTAEEDLILSEYIRIHGDDRWTNLPKKAGLKRTGTSYRLRWLNYLRPDIKRGNISPDEEELVIRMHRLLGNRWSLIAGRLPGRTDNEIKNYWNTHLSKKLAMEGSQPKTRDLKRRSPSPSPLHNHVFNPIPLKITTAARPHGCNGNGSNHSSADAAFKLSNVQETTNFSESRRCDLRVENSIVNDESERIVFAMVDVNHVGTEVTNPTCFMSSLQDRQCPHCDKFAQSLMDLGKSFSPDCNLLRPPSDCLLPDIGFEEFYVGSASLAAETNEFEDMHCERSPEDVFFTGYFFHRECNGGRIAY